MISTCHERMQTLFGPSGLRAPGSLPQFCRITLEQSVIIAPCLPQVLQIGHIARWQVQYDSELAIVLSEPRF